MNNIKFKILSTQVESLELIFRRDYSVSTNSLDPNGVKHQNQYLVDSMFTFHGLSTMDKIKVRPFY